MLARSIQWHKVLMLKYSALAEHMKLSFCIKCRKNKFLNATCVEMVSVGETVLYWFALSAVLSAC